MSSTPIVESDSWTPTLLKPTAGESASAPGLATDFLQGAANRFKFLHVAVDKFRSGGVLSLGGALTFSGFAVTFTHAINGVSAALSGALTAASATLSGALQVDGNTTLNGILNSYRRAVSTGPDTNETVTNYASGTILDVPTLTASRNYNFVTPASASLLGDHYFLVNRSGGAFNLVVQVDGVTKLSVTPGQAMHAYFNGTLWVFISFSGTIATGP